MPVTRAIVIRSVSGAETGTAAWRHPPLEVRVLHSIDSYTWMCRSLHTIMHVRTDRLVL